MTNRRVSEQRDQAPSSFAPTLGRLCESAGVVSTVLVDRDGEAVDYAGRTLPFDLKVAGAEWRIVLARLQRAEGVLRETEQMLVRGGKKSFGIVRLPEGYALVLELLPHCFRISKRALDEAVREICEEADLSLEEPPADWARVQVREAPGSDRLPQCLWLSRKWAEVEILSRCSPKDHGLRSNERGYLVRFPSGAEATLVREPLSQWFARPAELFR